MNWNPDYPSGIIGPVPGYWRYSPNTWELRPRVGLTAWCRRPRVRMLAPDPPIATGVVPVTVGGTTQEANAARAAGAHSGM